MMNMARLLVVDDSPTIRKLVEISFRGSEWVVDYAASGAEGVSLAKRHVPDAILLDFVLPDMRGIDVCERLSHDTSCASIPVVVMTAKGESIRDLFRPYRSFASWVGKPFTSDTIVASVTAAVERERQHRAPGARTGFTRAQKEMAAKAVFGRLKSSFASIPSWCEKLGSNPAAAYFARKILTPEVMDDLLEALVPVLRGMLESRARESDGVAVAPDALFHGRVEAWPIDNLLTFFSASGRRGELTLTASERATIAYFCDGEVVIVTSRDPSDYMHGGPAAIIARAPRDAMEAAKHEQRATGKPVYVSLAEQGHFPPSELTEALHHQGRRLLLEAVAAKSARFAWRDLPALPAFVEAHGRHVSTARNTLVFGAREAQSPPSSTLEQLSLERLRAAPVDHPLAPADAVFTRVHGFGERVRRFDLDADERRVLALVDGRQTIEEIGARSGLELRRLCLVIHRLNEVGLLARCDVAGSRMEAETSLGRPVMILEPDLEGVQRPLQSLLQNRAEPVALLSVHDPRDMVAAIRRARPCLVILNAAATGDALEETVRTIRTSKELGNVSLVALLESEMETRASELSAAGFDAVLVKPIAYTELERWIT